MEDKSPNNTTPNHSSSQVPRPPYGTWILLLPLILALSGNVYHNALISQKQHTNLLNFSNELQRQAEKERKQREEIERLRREQDAQEAARKLQRLEAVSALTAQGFSPKHFNNSLQLAAQEGNLELVKLLIHAGADVNSTAPIILTQQEPTEVDDLQLLTTDINLNIPQTKGLTPLYRAVYFGHKDLVAFLLTLPGIDVNKADATGETPLYWAAYQGYSDIVSLLLKAPGIDVNKAEQQYGWTPLLRAASDGLTEIVNLLIQAPDINVNAMSKVGDTPLSCAAINGRTNVVRALLKTPGIDIEQACDTSGLTKLRLAASCGLTEWILELINNGVDPNTKDAHGYTPLCQAACIGQNDVVKILLTAPDIDVNLEDAYGWTPLCYAASQGHIETVKMLLAAPGIDANKANNEGETPLHCAVSAQQPAIVRLLLQVPHIQVNNVAEGNRTPWNCTNNATIRRILKEAGAKPYNKRRHR